MKTEHEQFWETHLWTTLCQGLICNIQMYREMMACKTISKFLDLCAFAFLPISSPSHLSELRDMMIRMTMWELCADIRLISS